MYEPSYDNSTNYETFMEIIENYNLTAQEVVNYLVDWHGLRILNHDFMENLIDCEL